MGHVTLKAKKSIPIGDPITINYCTVLLNTETRLTKLKNTKYFICNCSLCLDPTEKGTFMSADINVPFSVGSRHRLQLQMKYLVFFNLVNLVSVLSRTVQ